MNDVSAREPVMAPAAPQAAAAPEGAAARRGRLKPLLGLMPFVARYKARAAAALLALLVASAATLAVPIAVRRMIDLGFSVERIEQLVARAAPRAVVVEAAGGLLVPLAREVASLTLEQADPAERAPAAALVTNLDLAERLGLPVLLVGRAGLGTLNHCALSAEALARRGVELRAIVLNRVVPEDDPSVATNARLVEELTGAMVLGPTPFIADASARPAAIAIALARLVGGG